VKDGVFLVKVIVAAVTVANITYIAAFHGYIGIPGIGPGDCERDCVGGRASGPFQHPNSTGPLIAAMLPAYVAIARSSRGFSRALWIAGAMCSMAMLLMTASRGAFVAMLIGYPWAAYVFRRYLSLRQILLWTGALIALSAVVLILAGPQVAVLIGKRFVTESGGSDIGGLSSGRTEFWARALGAMMSMPLTLITGFGYDAYENMGFVFAPHNEYLRIWFELGLVGLCTFVFLVLRALSTVRSSVDWASPLSRRYLIAFVFGFGALLIAIFFGNASGAWTYMWAYVGVSLRMALVAVETRDAAPAVAAIGGKRHVGLRERRVPTGSSRLVKPSASER
jgi:O-antigen ligase